MHSKILLIKIINLRKITLKFKNISWLTKSLRNKCDWNINLKSVMEWILSKNQIHHKNCYLYISLYYIIF